MFGRRVPEKQTAFGRQRAASMAKRRAAVPVRHSGCAGGRERSAAFSRRTAAKSGLNRRVNRPSPSFPGAESDRNAVRGADWGRVRLWSVGIFFALIWLTLWGRAYQLQIVKGPEYAAMAKRQQTTRELVQGVRGSILDRNGNVLARSVECASVWANPLQIEDKQTAAVKLGEALRLPVARLLGQLHEQKKFVWLRRKVDSATALKIRELKLPGVYQDTEYERVYPYRQLAGQLLGFVDIDDKGIEGLEKSFDADLAGRVVTQVVERDASGRRLTAQGTGSLVDLRGRNVRLTLDMQVQFFAEEALAENVEKFGARWGGCIVVDVPTGDILAWAQYPFFDPNNIAATPASDRRNRLATDMLEQGSTIKSFLIAAALEEKVVTPQTVINCEKGLWKLRNAVLHDTHPYAKLPVGKVLHVSSNIAAAKIGLMLGSDKYRGYLARLGFGERTGLPIAGEARGILRRSGKWADIDLATASFGQSFSATLAQMAKAYLCLASGGVKKPLLLVSGEGEEPSSRPASSLPQADTIFSEETMEQVRGMLREVVEEEGGTGKQARIPGIIVGGKTGTAQKADATGKYGRGRVGSFVGMIPIENPRYLICVLLDEPTKVQYGGVIAAPVFRHVALNTMAYHGLLPDSDDPLVQAIALKEAERKKGKKNANPGLAAKPAVSGRQTAGRADAPGEGNGPPPGRSVQAAGRVPAVVGMGLRSAVEIFAARGVMPVIKGTGDLVTRQSPEAGSLWPDDAGKCTLWLEERIS